MVMYREENGKRIELSIEEETKILEEWAKNDLEAQKSQYILNRKEAYGALENQLDLLFHQGFDAWKAFIQSVKNKYPKPK